MFNQLIISKFACRYITNNIKWIKWIKWINMDKQLKRKDLVLVKWNSKYMTDREGCSLSEGVRYLDRDIETSTVGYFIEEDDKAIVLASSIYGINIPDSLCKDCMVIPKAYISETIVLDAQFGPLNH